MEYAIDNNWSIGGEYLRTIYEAVKLKVPASRGENNYATLNYKPNVNTFNARLKYTF